MLLPMPNARAGLPRSSPRQPSLNVILNMPLNDAHQTGKLIVFGSYLESNPYHCAIKAAASSEVCFVGAIYDQAVVQALRFHCAAYVHGHQVGGTNPSLVEALGAGNAVIAHDNRFNRWVAGEGAVYFDGVDAFASCLDELLGNPDGWPVLSEESAHADYSVRSHWKRFWLVDPLDGTKEFVKRNGEFTVNIALVENGKPISWVLAG